MRNFRHIVALALLAAAPLASALAQDGFPAKPVKIVVPFPPGGTSDSVARLIANNLKDKLDQPVIVDNKGGGGTVIGTDIVAKSAGDGHTLLWAATPFAINHSLYPGKPYDTFKDFVPVVDVVSMPLVLIVPASSSARSLKDLIDQAKKAPGRLSYGSSGNGGSPHLAMEVFKSAAGIDIKHVPYRGSAPALTDLLGAQTDLMIDTVFLVTPYVTSGKVRALAQTGVKRSGYLPAVPTMREAGIEGYEVGAWFSLMAPAGTPKAVVRRLNVAVNEVLKLPAVREQMEQQGLQVTAGTPEDATRHLKVEVDKFANAVRSSGVKPE